MVIARLFGAGVGADAFFVAFKIPNFLRRLFAEGAFSQAFAPVLAEYKSAENDAGLKPFVDRVAGTLGLILALVTALGILAAPVLIALFAPGFLLDGDRYDLAVDMLRLTFPYLLFISLTAFAGSILNSFGRFGAPSFTPALLNLCLIGAALLLSPRMAQPVTALAWGVLLAGVAQLALQLPFLWRLGILPRPRVDFRHPGVRKIGRLMLPAVFAVSVTQINLLVDTLIASFLAAGSVSWLYYSDRLVEFPLAVFATALSTVILPRLSREHVRADPASFSNTLDWALRWVLIFGSAALTGLLLLAAPILATLFQYGAFSPGDVEMASRSLMAYAVGLPAFMLIKVLAPGFFARQDAKTPVRIAVIAMLVNIALNIVLVFPLAHAGLALATSLSACLNAGLLFRGLRRAGVCAPKNGWPALLARIAVANLALAAVLLWGSGELSAWLAWGALRRAAHLSGWILAGAAVYMACLWLAGLRPSHLR